MSAFKTGFYYSKRIYYTYYMIKTHYFRFQQYSGSLVLFLMQPKCIHCT